MTASFSSVYLINALAMMKLSRDMYVNPKTGEVWQEGDTVTDLVFARTLDIIAAEGPEAIHNGSLTSQLVADITRFGGIITEEDLRTYQ